MDFREADELAAHRAAARAWADANVAPEWADEQRRSGCHQTPELHARLARDGILAAGWPPEYGGSDVDPGFARAVFDECARRGLHVDGWATTSMVIHTIRHVGTEEQKRTYLPAARRGELLVALGYSEADSGSDVAAAKTTAVRAGEDWVVNGQKMFTSSAQVCSHVFVLARTDPAAPKHQGLTLFLVPTGGPGYASSPSTPSAGRSPTPPSTPTSGSPTPPASAGSTRGGA
jgi:3-oxocholest-4-en-26-oyl-CoA dehydrogenase alpha subunit